MNIQDAVKQAVKEDKWITRADSFWSGNLKIKPTDTPDCCIISHRLAKSPSRGWQPQAEDLAASDWELVD